MHMLKITDVLLKSLPLTKDGCDVIKPILKIKSVIIMLRLPGTWYIYRYAYRIKLSTIKENLRID